MTVGELLKGLIVSEPRLTWVNTEPGFMYYDNLENYHHAHPEEMDSLIVEKLEIIENPKTLYAEWYGEKLEIKIYVKAC